MKSAFNKTVWLTLVVFSLGLSPLPLRAGLPTDQMRATADKVVELLKDPRLKSEDKKKVRRNLLRKVIYSRFDFAEMAKRSLGSHWHGRTSKEQREFVKVFTELLEKAYVDAIESYNAERILYRRERQDHDYAEVETLIFSEGEEFSIDYRLRLVSRDWKVYDVVIENISLVNNYRSQFNRVIRRSSYEDLVRRLRERRD